MNSVKIIAGLLTEDPDVFHSSVILAVHPNYVVDAASAASSKFTDSPETYGPHRLKILKTYINRFRRFIDGQMNGGATIIVTTLGEPYQLNHWYDKISHWENDPAPKGYKMSQETADWEKADIAKMKLEQEEVQQLHQGMMDYIYKIAGEPNVYIVPEKSAGEACRQGKLDHILDNADEMQVIGGNLSGCLENTVKSIRKRPSGPSVKVLHELSFDDDPEFWEANI